MNENLNAQIEDLDLIRRSASDFAQMYIKPHVMEWDESQTFPVEIFRQMGDQGFMGVLVPESYGGSGLNYEAYIAVLDEISQVCGSIGLSLAAHNSLCTNHILLFGNEDQKSKYLPLLASGKWIGAWGLTETNTGSDAGAMQTVAVRDGNDWILNGSKNFITHAISGDVSVVIARTGAVGESNSTTAFIIEKGTPGFTAGKKENKMGMRASETACLFFDNCRVPNENVLGKVGEGFKQSLGVLDGGRISIATLALGIAKGAYKAALDYAQQREQFGKPIAQFQAIGFKLAEMATKIETAELLIMKAGSLKDQGQKVTKVSAMAKYYASEIAVEVANESVQIHGGYGFTKDYPAEKFYRDVKLCTIGEGTTEIQKIVISREILKEAKA
ncbi:acyl-CoA dehydrogenase [Pedobacter sp. HMF7647]|uniref:Cyclohex-1-ene-1-carbonyl-CoA dehydrogenase n=1 Tax=Hufsiella arboris TaxID=2695275 RepID=A0A7K1Y7C9_9SPHI|nr:acyl-CoA dehydrogenase family protein [Hufsiella arboris]MXV50467.1 acyl-CoA dehydrogenase [Hufsiella arboris]